MRHIRTRFDHLLDRFRKKDRATEVSSLHDVPSLHEEPSHVIQQKSYGEKQIRRICLYGGPGSGKSETAAWLYSQLKALFIESDSDVHIEQAQEYVKRWAYQGVKIQHFDQIYIFGKQMRTVELPLRNGVDLVITDSPMPLQVCFAHRYDLPYAPDLESQAMWFEKAYPAIHIFVNRDNRKYYPGGRYESEAEALRMDWYIKTNVANMLRAYSDNGRLAHAPKLWEISYKDKEEMMQLITEHIFQDRA